MSRFVVPGSIVAALALLVSMPAYAAGTASQAQGASPKATTTSPKVAGTSEKAMGTAGSHWLSGKVTSIDQRELTVASGEQVRLTRHTRFLQGKQHISRKEIKAGENVRAAYVPRGKLAYATEVQLVKEGASSAGTTAPVTKATAPAAKTAAGGEQAGQSTPGSTGWKK